jgi:16S rRNA (cytidine1402-2'-O)-methyltransferase
LTAPASPGTLYLVSTPIGNLGDITFRAADVLRRASVVLAEDTRRTAILLRHVEASVPMLSAHEHNEAARVAGVLERLGAGEEVALVSDAGTPLLSDPGRRIVEAAIEAGHAVVPVPGASALLAALVASGLPAEPFTFFGFPPRKGRERDALLDEVAGAPRTSVLYESPNRLVALLEDLASRAGEDRRVAVARELTKLHEEFVRGGAAEVAAHFREDSPRGEIVVVVSPAAEVGDAAVDEAAGDALARALLAEGHSSRDVVRELRRRLGISRNDAYRIALAAETSSGDADR